MEEIMTLKEVASYLRISESELRKLMSQKEISFIEIGGKESKRKIKRFNKRDVINYLQRNSQGES